MCLDSPQNFAYIVESALKRWKLSVDEVHELAIRNLVERSAELEVKAGQDEEGRVALAVIQTMDGYDASRILLPTLHERLSQYLGSPFLAGIPNRDFLICFRDSPEVVASVTAADRGRLPQDAA